jgi:dolichol-phosphate mannosyltransferase
VTVSKDQVTIVIPTLNEERAIGVVLDELKQHGYKNVLVVDGYSKDNTVKIANLNGARVLYQHSRGKTGALRTAVEHVDTPYLVVMDGDATYDPSGIERLLAHADHYDEVIGYRAEGRDHIPWLHRLGNWVITKAFNLLMGTDLSDVCSGMWLLRTERARQLELNSSGFGLEVEVAAQVRDSATEVPVGYRPRVGKKKLGTWREGLRILASLVRLARAYNPVLLFSAIASLSIIPACIILGWVALEVLLWHRWRETWLMLGTMLLLFASQAVAVSTVSILLKRMESRIMQSLRKE